MGRVFFQKVVTRSDRESVLDFRLKVYTNDWPGIAQSSVNDDIDARAVHFAAFDDCATVIAAFRLVPPEARPFDLERFLDINAFLTPTSRPAEVGRLCIEPKHRRMPGGFSIARGLFDVALVHAQSRDITDLFLKAAPRLRKLYANVGFERIGTPFTTPGYGAEQAMHLRLLDRANRGSIPRNG